MSNYRGINRMVDGKPETDDMALTGNLRIPQGLKQEIKVAAVQRRMREYRLIEEVWKFWKERPKPAPVPDLTEEEGELVQAVLDFWRDPAARAEDPGGIATAVLKAFIERYRAKGGS